MAGIVIALGTVNVDVRLRAERWPGAGEMIPAHALRVSGGGRGANVCVAARRLGASSRLVGRVGDDDIADAALACAARAGVDLQYVQRVPRAATGVALILVRADGAKAMSFAPNANSCWRDEDGGAVRLAVARSPVDSMLVTDLAPPGPVVRAALAEAHRRGRRVIVDPTAPERLTRELYASVDYATPNASEAARLTGRAIRSVADAFGAADALVQRGIPHVLVKLDAQGTVVVSAHVRTHVTVPRVRPVDTTGAGDAFAGALAVALIEGRRLADAARFAAATAAISITRPGAQTSYPNRAEVETLMRETRAA